MTDSSTPCCKKTPDALSTQGVQRRALVAQGMACAGVALLGHAPAWAQEADEPLHEELLAHEKTGLELQRDGDDLLLTSSLHWVLPEMVQDALLKGIAVHFIAQADMQRERWYWRNQELLSAERFMRLSYQPLTRRWRLYTGSHPFEGQGLGVALSNTFETLQEAVQAMQRIVRWRIGAIADLPRSGRAVLQLRFRIDISRFPRPLQIGALGHSDWNLLVLRSNWVDLEKLQ